MIFLLYEILRKVLVNNWKFDEKTFYYAYIFHRYLRKNVKYVSIFLRPKPNISSKRYNYVNKCTLTLLHILLEDGFVSQQNECRSFLRCAVFVLSAAHFYVHFSGRYLCYTRKKQKGDFLWVLVMAQSEWRY